MPEAAGELLKLLLYFVTPRSGCGDGDAEPTLEQQQQTRDSERQSEVAGHPLVRAVLEAFPGATIAAVRERFVAAPPAAEDEAVDEDGGGNDGIDGVPGDSEEDEA